MSEVAKQKDAFYRVAIAHGISSPAHIREAFPLGYTVSDVRLEAWLKRLSKLSEFGPQRRYVNRFKLGADPEFVFSTMSSSVEDAERIDATHLGMKQGPAFGADNNGRLAEIRPHPSRSVLKVCASILTTLRWMSVLVPDIQRYQWRSGAYLFGDGIGGHVHMGRKRPQRNMEVKALDGLSDLLLEIGVYPMREVVARREGDRLGQRYGRPGDFRLQAHGYEYRTFPSWLDSPELAFLTITLSKLCVHCPELVLGMTRSMSGNVQTRLKNLLAYFKDKDDDALLALYILKRGFPKHVGGDFKARWGIDGRFNYAVGRPAGIKIVPLSIPPGEEDVDDLFQYFTKNKALEHKIPKPTWSPVAPPRGYLSTLDNTNTHQMKGLGEMIWDIVSHADCPISFGGSAKGAPPLVLPSGVAKMLPSGWRKQFPFPVTVANEGTRIMIECSWRESDKCRQMKRTLLNGVLPIWDVRKVRPESYSEWRTGTIPAPPLKFKGKVITATREVA